MSTLWLASILAFGTLVTQSPAAGLHAGVDSVRPSTEPGTVTIYRDDWGVPHVYAEKEEDGYYGLGYVLGEDRLVNVLHRYLKVRGELAAAFGPDSLESDLVQLRWRHMEESRAGFERLDPQLQTNHRYFIAGLQHYMDDHPEMVPPWAPPLDPVLPVAYTRSWYWPLMGGIFVAKCMGARVPFAHGGPAGERGSLLGSNVWAVMPWRTADGAVIHLTDSHGIFEGAGEMWEFRLDAGDLKMAATSVLGTAWMLKGHTRYHAWGWTNGFTDVADCYEVQVDPETPTRYRYDGNWKDMVVHESTVAVRGGAPERHTFEYTEHNGVLSPVVAREGSKAYVLSIPYMHRAGGLDEEMYRHQHARNLDEFIENLQRMELIGTNIMVGEAHGNTYYLRPGRVPIRPDGYDWSKPVPGNTSATAWRGIHPLEDLIQLRNPAQGYMHNNNVAPDAMVDDSLISASQYPSYIFNDTPGRTHDRGTRAAELLSRAYAMTLEDALEITFDEKWVATESWLGALRDALRDHAPAVRDRSPEFRRFVHRLIQFDGFARKESVGALNFLYWRTGMAGDDALSSEELDRLTELVESGGELSAAQQIILIEGVERAIEAMVAEHGSTTIPYGEVYRVGRGGYSWPLGGGQFQAGNRRIAPLRNMWFTPPDSIGQRWVIGGQRQPILTIFTDPIQSFSSLPFGQSGRSNSPHYSDQGRLLSERRLKPTYFYLEDLLEHAVSRRTLRVRMR